MSEGDRRKKMRMRRRRRRRSLRERGRTGTHMRRPATRRARTPPSLPPPAPPPMGALPLCGKSGGEEGEEGRACVRCTWIRPRRPGRGRARPDHTRVPSHSECASSSPARAARERAGPGPARHVTRADGSLRAHSRAPTARSPAPSAASARRPGRTRPRVRSVGPPFPIAAGPIARPGRPRVARTHHAGSCLLGMRPAFRSWGGGG